MTEVRKITCSVQCNSAEMLRRAKESARTHTGLNEEIVKTFVTFPGGIERRQVRVFRLADYFDKIELIPGSDDTFTLTFHILGGVDSYWKDLLATVIRSIRESAPGLRASFPRPESNS